jgi:hypothetical protein
MSIFTEILKLESVKVTPLFSIAILRRVKQQLRLCITLLSPITREYLFRSLPCLKKDRSLLEENIFTQLKRKKVL